MRNPNRRAAQRRAEEANGSDTLLIYYSENGSTMEYAKWISDTLGCDVIPYNKKNLGYASMYENIIFGTWIRNGELTYFNVLRRNLQNFGIENKNLFVYAVGIVPSSEHYKDFLFAYNQLSFLPKERLTLLPGRFDPNHVAPKYRTAIRTLGDKMLEAMPEESQEYFKQRLEIGYDGVNETALKPFYQSLFDAGVHRLEEK